jgi:hypothetical protein
MRCKACQCQIPDDALLCPYCGHSVPSPEPTVAPAKSAQKRTGIWVVVIALATVALVCFVCVLCWALSTATPSYKAASTAMAAAHQTEAARPTNTPSPITYADIQHSYDTLTDVQWESYEKGLRGTRIRWAAEVTEVKGDLTTYLDLGQGAFSRCYLNGLSREEAASLSKGDIIEFEATIARVDRILGMSVYLNEPVIMSRR